MFENKKKLIEVALPLDEINKASVREKSIRHGHPSTLHLWWARRPLATCRAVLFAQLVDDPSSNISQFPTETEQKRERERLFGIIEELVKWENTTNETVLEKARAEIQKSCNGKPPLVCDPFSGGGSIPLEAQRLGLKAFGSDLNPVAVMIGKALVEIPPKFAGKNPVNPRTNKTIENGNTTIGRGVYGLAEDIKYYGKWIQDEAEKKIGHLYPQITITEDMTNNRDDLKNLLGEKLRVIAWLWARTVASPNPALNGVHVPLVKSFNLSTKNGKQARVDPIIDRFRNSYQFTVKTGERKSKLKTLDRRGGKCLISGEPIPLNYIREEAKAGRMKAQMMAIVAKGPRGRVYLPPTLQMKAIAKSAEPDWSPDLKFSDKALGFNVQNYGMTRFSDLFTPRQLVALTTFSDLVLNARKKVLIDAKSAGMPDGKRLVDGGTDAIAYADAVTVYLAFVVDKVSDYWSSLCTWHVSGEKMRSTFMRHTLSMIWDYAEANPFSKYTGCWMAMVNWVWKSVKLTPALHEAHINQNNAVTANYVDTPIFSTDPPYYDNIGYADISDYFYVWLRKILKKIYPELFRTLLVPKEDELIASRLRHGSKDNAEQFFLNGMSEAISRMSACINDKYPTTIYYAYKQSEIKKEGITSTGWAIFLQAVIEAGFSIVGTWPMRTELKNRLIGQNANALASSIVLVCRKRTQTNSVITRAEFLKVLRVELPKALKVLQKSNIAPVDLVQASIGPGIAIFSRHATVLESDDSVMTVKAALQIINAALDEYLSEQDVEYDDDTRFAITWFESHGMESGLYGEAETLATARAVSVSGVKHAGILESKGGRVRLFSREELADSWDPETDNRPTIWESTQHLIRVLQENGEQSAADLLGKLGSKGENAKELAYRLYGICERKNWAKEGPAYNSLVVSWPELTRLAAMLPKSEIPIQNKLELRGELN